MANTFFDKPLFVKKALHIQELASLESVVDFLNEWPEEQQGDTYQVLMKACRMAEKGVFPVQAIRENVRRFLMKAGILANFEEVPLMPDSDRPQNIGS
ncbi:DUF982 domain-containing protein (plasmid) [Rhizobium sp. B230/85]|uniref:DUF982 domain-containing protein n=1 Tax=unclassified Rhizobium TaxID=2613769 RepID=UPI001AD9FAFB|nr:MULTISPECIES: DUF982 domain-containing protein [unclassified Rhizobium]MBO9136217.1 DUF982 domain-containing protein [Rhizobium sp. B209b/85]QXZ99904.1 DUF982 domain-containing protein [Rhizobium sp. B230/85]